MKIVTNSGKELEQGAIAGFGLLDNPKPNQRRAIPRDEVKMDSYYGTDAVLGDIKRILDLNPGSQLYVHISISSTGFWTPVEIQE